MTPTLQVLTALRLEARAVRRGLPEGAPVQVHALGAGPRARAAAAAGAVGAVGGTGAEGTAVAVAGVAGGVTDLPTGTVVVASEVCGPDGTRPCPSAPLLAGALARAGLPVALGPVATVERLATRAARRRLAATGALAVDLESAHLAALAGPAPLAVLRVLVDTPQAELLSPGTVGRGLRALRRLGACAPALASWAAATGVREVVRAEPASFCAGVERAIAAVEEALDRHGAPVYVRRQIVHNSHVVDRLRGRGAVFVDELDAVPDGAATVFSAHGVGPTAWQEAARKGLTVIDATCPLVGKVHTEARRFASRGEYVVLIGHAGHDEVEGTLAEAPGRLHLVEGPAAVAALPDPGGRPVRYLTQTTLAADEAAATVAALRARFGAVHGPAGEDICYATTNRQAAVREVAGRTDVVLVVGSANSSNSQRLVEVAGRGGTPAHLVEDARDVDLRWLAGARCVGLSAGASAPPELAEEVVGALAGLAPAGGLAVVTHRVAREDVAFAPPREVRLP